MKVSSLTPPPMEARDNGHSTPSLWHRIKFLYHRLDRMLTIIACAEAGNFDAVKAMLDQDEAARSPVKSRHAHKPRRSGRVVWDGKPAWSTAPDWSQECTPAHLRITLSPSEMGLRQR